MDFYYKKGLSLKMKELRLKEPKFDYYDEFIKNVDIALEISNTLQNYIENFDISNSQEVEEKVHGLENDADRNLHKILNFLVKDFLPPIDREDIVLLANKIDDTIDYLDEIVINLDILSVNNLRKDFKSFVEIINKLSIMLKKMFQNFKNTKKYEEIHNMVIEINNIEEEGDKIYENAIRELYKNESNPIEILKWNTIYNSIENIIDSYESVANTVGEIVLKNS